jgi:hypothetical protein
VHSAQILISSVVLVSFVPADHEARIAMRGFLPGSSEEQLQLSMLPPPPPRTHEQNVADGKISKAARLASTNPKHPSKKNGRKDQDIFSKFLPYWNRWAAL